MTLKRKFENTNEAEETINITDENQTMEDVSVKDKIEEILPKEGNDEINKLKLQIEKLNKQYNDTKDWGGKQRAAYILAKKRTEELAKNLFDNGTIFEEEYNILQNIFNHSFNTDDLQGTLEEKQENPFKSTIDNIQKTFDEYKRWSDDKELDLKFKSFFKNLELVTPKKLKDIQEYFLSENDPKESLKYILSNGEKYYNKFYKHAEAKGDGFSYIEELLNKNENLEKKVKELELELEENTGKIYNKTMKSSNSMVNKPTNTMYQRKFI